jgi:hypothetical protein
MQYVCCVLQWAMTCMLTWLCCSCQQRCMVDIIIWHVPGCHIVSCRVRARLTVMPCAVAVCSPAWRETLADEAIKELRLRCVDSQALKP